MDFAQLVAKMNEIEKNEPPKVIQETGEMKTEVGATKDLLSKFNEIQDTNPYEPVVAEAKVKEEEVEETMQDRFAKFMKAERESGTEVEEMRVGLEEASAEYEYADRAFSKMSETINMLEKMCREGGMLETKIKQAGGEERESLADMRQALSDAYEACEQAHYDALGSGDSSSGE